MSDPRETRSDEADGRKRLPTARELQQPIGQQSGEDGTWLSGDDEDDDLRDEAAERARGAVEPGRERE